MNTGTKHTPGPWTIISGDGWPIIRSTITHDNIASIRGTDADACIISAAPDLLDALKALVETCEYGDHNYEEYNNAYKAIAKATGQES